MRSPRFLLLLVSLAGALYVLQTNAWGPFRITPNVIRWVTQSEEETFGYDIYRSRSKQGPFERINTQSILGAGTTDLPQPYEFSDKDVENATVYWYYVESISLDGDRERVTPMSASKPKSAAIW